MDENKIRYLILENISEGVISINSDEKIKIINKKAKEIFGIVNKQNIGHSEGAVEEGDIIIIGDNSLGFDDGGIDSKDLRMLGVSEDIPLKSAFVYIGRYKKGGEYIYTDSSGGDNLLIKKNISSLNIKSEIDFIQKRIIISVNNVDFPYDFIKGIGHIVILDKDSLEIKFYQSKGYSVRKEDLKSILNGNNFLKKLPNVEMEIGVQGEKVRDILGESESIKMLLCCARGEKIDYVNKYDEINGRPVRCSVYPLNYDNIHGGAFLKVEDLSEVSKVLKEKNEILKKLLEIQDKTYDPFKILIGESKVIGQVITYAKKAALTSSTVLLQGESGTGKSLIAKSIHDYSSRKKEKFVELNCGALSENLLESELFGYVEGAFTGAKREGKKGLIEYANGGTLFLDEISEMPLNLQVKLLHVIQNRRIIPVGGTKAIDLDVRFICATNKDLEKMVGEGKFREDLYYRINVLPISMPSLRDRKDDLYALVQSILQKFCKKCNIQYKLFTNEAFNKLYSYNFPGNIRELENILERSLNVVEGDYIGEEDIMINSDRVENNKTLKEIIESTEKRAIISYLRRFSGDKQKAMEALGIKKTAFYEKLKRYQIK
jgi:sigma-54 dependent transcriptional regulator, acetoin dehydrogenase operon transcriptional activator AcoR